MSRQFRSVLILLSIFVISSCTQADHELAYVERPVEELYNEALSVLEAGKYADASLKFEEVERQHPYSSWATKAQLMSAYSYYQDDAYDSAIIALDRFIQLHPSNAEVPYAFYLKALCYYEQISEVTRDQRMTDLAQNTLSELVKRFPTSKYAKDAKLKIDLTRDHLAGKEIEIGRYYQKQGQYLAAVNRFTVVIEKYQSTTHVPEALHRLAESYVALGLQEQAQKAAAVLGHNFPGSDWYLDSYRLVDGKLLEPVQGDAWYKFW